MFFKFIVVLMLVSSTLFSEATLPPVLRNFCSFTAHCRGICAGKVSVCGALDVDLCDNLTDLVPPYNPAKETCDPPPVFCNVTKLQLDAGCPDGRSLFTPKASAASFSSGILSIMAIVAAMALKIE